MSLQAGLVGLPNVGKSTLFNALLSRTVADAQNYPFCTIEPNVGVVEVPDERLPKLAKVVNTQKIIPAAIEFVDIAGLVEGAHKGEGLGNKFLSHIREVDVIIMVLRDFENDNIVRAGSTNPENDMQILLTELQLADLAQLEKQNRPNKKLSDEEKARYDAIDKIRAKLEQGKNASEADLTKDEAHAIKSFGLLTLKPIIIVLNTDEEKLNELFGSESSLRAPMNIGEKQSIVALNAKLEADMAGMTRDERIELLNAYGIEKPGLEILIKKTYETLGLITFLTAGEKEVRAWPILKGTLAPQAAGAIHTDFEKGFVKAKIANFEDFIGLKGWKGVMDAGKVRFEGKDYEMQEGDVVEFMING